MATIISEEQHNEPYREEAREQLEKIAKDWPEGELVEGTYNRDDEALNIQYYYEPTATGGMGAVEINLYIDVKDPAAAFEEMRRDALESKPWRRDDKAVNGFDEWPHGFPDQNDYEQVSHCGATKDRSKAFWVQNKTLVVLATMPDGGTKLYEYADGMWQVVNLMGL